MTKLLMVQGGYGIQEDLIDIINEIVLVSDCEKMNLISEIYIFTH